MNRATAFFGLVGKPTWLTLAVSVGMCPFYWLFTTGDVASWLPPDPTFLAAVFFPAVVASYVTYKMWWLYVSTFAAVLPALRPRLLTGFLALGVLVSVAVPLVFWRPGSGHHPVVLFSVAMAAWCVVAGVQTVDEWSTTVLVMCAGFATMILSGSAGAWVRSHPILTVLMAVCAMLVSAAEIGSPDAVRRRYISRHAGNHGSVRPTAGADGSAVLARHDSSARSAPGYRTSLFSYVVAASLDRGRSGFRMFRRAPGMARGLHSTVDDRAFAGAELVLRSLVLTIVAVIFVGISGTAMFWMNTEQSGTSGSFAGAAIRAVLSIDAGRGMPMAWTYWMMLAPLLMSPMFMPVPRMLRSTYPLSRQEKASVAYGLTLVDSIVWVATFVGLVAVALAVASVARAAVTSAQARTAVCGFIGVLALLPLAEVLRYRRSNDNPARVRPSVFLIAILAYLVVGLMPVWTRSVAAWPLPPGGDIVFWITLVAASHVAYGWWLRRYFAKADLLQQAGPRRFRVVT